MLSMIFNYFKTQCDNLFFTILSFGLAIYNIYIENIIAGTFWLTASAAWFAMSLIEYIKERARLSELEQDKLNKN